MGIGKEIASFFVRIGADTSGLNKGQEAVKGSFLSLGNIIKAGGALIASHYAKMALDAGVEMMRMGAEHERLEASFTHLVTQYGSDADELLAALKRASGGTIAEGDLMLAQNRAILLGLGADVDKMAQLMEIARFRGRAMGLTTAQAFSDIVTGIGRASPLILDNLGIVLDAKTVYGEYAAAIGKTAEQLTEAEQKQALLNAVLRDGANMIREAGGISSDAADKFEQWDAVMKDLKVAAGELLLSYAELVNKTGAFDWIIERTKVWVDILKMGKEIVDKISEKIYGKPGQAGGGGGGGFKGDGGVAQSDYLVMTYETAVDRRMQKERRLEDQQIRLKEAEEARKEADKELVSSTKALSNAYDNFASVIEGFMSPTSVTEWDVIATDLGQYVDKWDEYARRLEDVKKRGLASPWASLVGDVSSDQEARLKAQRMQEDFYAFLNPEAINKEALKEQYRRYLQSEKNKKQFIAELWGEIGGSKGEAEAFLGQPGVLMGQGIAEGVASGIGNASIVAPIANKLKDDVAKNADLLKAAGASIYGQLLEGIKGAIKTSTQIIELLAQAIAPEVAAIIERERNRGAEGAIP